MKLETSGKIFRFPLDFDMGYGYAEQNDFSDIYTFDGILVSVFKLIDTSIEDRSLEEIKQSEKLFGPVPIYRYPPSRGKSKWVHFATTPDFLVKKWPVFKMYQGNDYDSKDWSKLSKWRIVDREKMDFDLTFHNYEHLRHLETTILNTAEGVATKITMMKLIENGKNVDEYYDLNQRENHNLYVQLVNTYYKKETAAKLLEIVDDIR